MNSRCFIVSYDHGGLVLWGERHFEEHLRELYSWLERHPKLKMGLDNEAWTYDWLAENRPRLIELIREGPERFPGRFAIGSCTYGQPLAAFILGESNIRQIELARETVRRCFSFEVDVYSYSEHAAFPQMPQILRGPGIGRALLRTHYLMYGYCPGSICRSPFGNRPTAARSTPFPLIASRTAARLGTRPTRPVPSA